MNFSSLYSSLSFIKPEITISITLILLVVFDLIFQKKKTIIPVIALVGLFISGIFVINELYRGGFAFTLGNKRFGMVTIDSFGSYFKLLVIITSILIVFFSYSSAEIQKVKDRLGEYYALIFGMILGMLFLISSSDLILIYLSMELLSLSSYVLAGFTKLRDRNSEASLKYLIYGAVSTGTMLFGISLIYGLVGSTNLYDINTALRTLSFDWFTFYFAVILMFVGIGYKISAVPFHFWTPDVYEGAPISITAFLSVASKAAGFAFLIRLLKTSLVAGVEPDGTWQMIHSFDWKTFIAIISVLTMTFGNFTALWQDNLKRMLAYSSIAHAGYLLLGVTVLSDIGVESVLIYFAFYMLMNIGSFYIVMLIANKTGSENINDYNGMGYATPFLGVSFAIFLVSLTGLPPTAGFIGKLYLFVALINSKMIILAVIAVVNSVVSLYYYIRVLKHMFLTKSEKPLEKFKTPLPNLIFILILVIPVLFLGIYFTPVVDLAKSCITILGF